MYRALARTTLVARMEDETQMERRRVLIMGAAGRDFHNFNVVYRDDDRV